MQRQEINYIADEILDIISRAQAAGRLKGYSINRVGGSFGSSDFTMKLHIAPVISPELKKEISGLMTPENLRYGLAPSGVEVCLMVNGKEERAEIIRARRVKYEIKMTTGPDKGKIYVINFGGVYLPSKATA